MRKTTFALFLSLLSLALAGCLGGDGGGSATAIRVGDTFAYHLDGEVTVRTSIASLETLDFQSRSPCTGVIMKRVWEADDGTATDTGESSFCTDPTLYQESYFDYNQPFTGDRIRWYTFGASTGLFDALVVCFLACDGFAGELEWRADHGLNDTSTARLERLDAGAFRFESRWTNGKSTEFNNGTFDLRGGQWPDRIVIERINLHPMNDPGERRSEFTMIWNLVDQERGTGPRVPFSKVEAAAFTHREGVSWDRFPPTGEAPFNYTIEEAHMDLRAGLEGLLWLEEHPDAFVTSARYGVWETAEGQRETAWNLRWADGEDWLGARCHRLVQTTPLIDLVTDQSCWDVQTARGEAVHRADFPDKTLDWGDLYERWAEIGGKRLPINNAYWTIFSEAPGLSSPHGPPGDITDRFTAEFGFYEGSLDTEPDSPNWLLLEPPSSSRALAGAQSIFDPSNGRPYVVQVPLE